MPKKHLLLSVLTSALLLAACSHQQNHTAASAVQASAISASQIQKSPNDNRSYAAILLPNQLQVVLVSDPTLESSAASMAIAVGSSSDPDSQLGLAHYLEHMLFLGTKKYPVPGNFMEFVSGNSGEANAVTAFDRTHFFFKVNSGKFSDALDRYSDYFKSPLLDAQYAEKERNAVNSEWSMNKSQDAWILQRIDGATINQANPFSRFTVGNLETLADKEGSNLQQQLKAFYERYYSANNMRLTLAGKQSIAELERLAKKYFASIPNKNITRPQVSIAGITQMEMGKSIHYQPQQDLKLLLVDFPLKNNMAFWRVKPNDYVNNLLGSEEAGTLCEQLRKTGLANMVTSSINTGLYGGDGYLRISVDLTNAGLNNRDKVVAAIFSYIDLVKRQGLNERYFQEMKAVAEKEFNSQAKPDILQQAVNIANNQLDLPLENVLNANYVYDHFDARAIQDLLDQLQVQNVRIWHIDKNQTVDTNLPHYAGQYSVRDIQPVEKQRWQQFAANFEFNLPEINNLFTDKAADVVAAEFLKPEAVVSEKGVEAFVVHPEFYREDKGVISLEVNVDFARQTAKQLVLSQLLNNILVAKNITLVERAKRASLAVEFNLSETNSPFISIAGATSKHEELLKSALDSLVNVSISEVDFIDALDKYKRALADNKKAIPLNQAYSNAMRLLSEAQWTDSEYLEAADKITLKDLLAYHREIKANPLLRIYAFGNYSTQTVTRFARLAAAALPGTKLPQQRKLAQFITPKVGQNIRYQAAAEQPDNVVIEAVLGDAKSDDEQAQFVVLNAFFGNAFFSQLRTNEQLGYLVGSGNYPLKDYPGFAFYVQSSNTELPQLKARMDVFRSEFMAILKKIEPARIEAFKQSERENVLQKPTDFYAESRRYSGEFFAGRYDFSNRDKYLASLARVNKENIIALYQKMLLDKKAMDILIQIKGESFKDTSFALNNPQEISR